MNNMKIKQKSLCHAVKICTQYEITNGEEKILLSTFLSGKVHIRPGNGRAAFVFMDSDPERVLRIAELFKGAAELAMEEIK